jgi:hypothetical protein
MEIEIDLNWEVIIEMDWFEAVILFSKLLRI